MLTNRYIRLGSEDPITTQSILPEVEEEEDLRDPKITYTNALSLSLSVFANLIAHQNNEEEERANNEEEERA